MISLMFYLGVEGEEERRGVIKVGSVNNRRHQWRRGIHTDTAMTSSIISLKMRMAIFIIVLIWCTGTWSSHLSFTSPLALAGCIIGSHRQQQDRALIDRYNQPRQAGPTGPLYKGSIQHGKHRFIISKDLGQTKMSLFCRYCDPYIRLLCFFLVSKMFFFNANDLFCPL